MIRILELPVDAQQIGWIKNTLTQQKRIIVEPWQKRLADFSMQIEVNQFAKVPKERFHYLGLTRMLSDHRGQYGGHQLGKKIDDLSEEIRKIFYQKAERHPPFSQIFQTTALDVGEWLWEQGFHGAAGIDAFLYSCKTGRIRAKPIVEVNARFTMGRVALKLEEYLSTGVAGLWIHMSKKRLEKIGYSDWNAWLKYLEEKIPTQIVAPSQAAGKVRLRTGVFPTNDPATAKSFLSVLLVHSDLQVLRNLLS